MRIIAFFVAAALLGAGGASAADLAPRAVEPAAPVYLPFTWTGFYAGANIGADFSTSKFTDMPAGNGLPWNAIGDTFSPDRTGFTGGIQAGYNWQMSHFVLGAEADFGYLGGTGTASSNLTPLTVGHIGTGYYGTLRARAGFAVDRLLIFATAGGIVADQAAYMSDTGLTATSKTGAQGGWTAGGGVEYAFTDNWTVKLDALYYDLGSKTVNDGNAVSGPTFRIKNSGELVRLGINYKF